MIYLGCIYRDESTKKDIIVKLNHDLTGDLLSNCKVLYCDEEANMDYRYEEGLYFFSVFVARN